jgi:hypothetical protein
MQRDEAQLAKLSHLQRELLVAAVDCVDADSPTGGAYTLHSIPDSQLGYAHAVRGTEG